MLLNSFYIIKSESSSGNWYMLFLRSTHYCLVNGSDYNFILDGVYKLVKKFKNEENLLKALNKTEDRGKVNSITFQRREEEYKERGDWYEDDLIEVIEKAMEENIEEDRKNKPFNKLKKRMGKVNKIVIEKEIEEEEEIEEIEERVIIKKPKIFKRKK